MTKDLSIIALIVSFALVSGTLMYAQDKPAPQPPARAMVFTPLKIQVVISRYQGDKRISSLPYTLSVNSTHTGEPNRDPAGRANLRMGAKIPVVMLMTAAPAGPDGKVPQVGPVQYQDVGTNIDCNVWPLEDGRYRVEITIDDTSVYTDDKESGSGTKGNPSFRSFRANDSMILKDGGTAQFTTATDKVSGELVKVDVTLTAVK